MFSTPLCISLMILMTLEIGGCIVEIKRKRYYRRQNYLRLAGDLGFMTWMILDSLK